MSCEVTSTDLWEEASNVTVHIETAHGKYALSKSSNTHRVKSDDKLRGIVVRHGHIDESFTSKSCSRHISVGAHLFINGHDKGVVNKIVIYTGRVLSPA